MVSRDTSVQFAAVLAAVALGALASHFGSGEDVDGLALVFAAAAYVAVFAGSHGYLALQGDGAAVPVAARWRFVALVLVATGSLLVGATFRNVTVAGTGLGTLLAVVVAGLFVGYWVYEARDGYQASRGS